MEQKNENTNAVVLTKEQEALVEKVKLGTWSAVFFDEKEELPLFDLPIGIRKEMLLAYVAKNSFCDEGDLKLFDLPEEERKEVLQALVSAGGVLSSETEVKIFDLPKEERDQILSAYIAGNPEWLGDKARTLFEQLPEEEQEKILGE